MPMHAVGLWDMFKLSPIYITLGTQGMEMCISKGINKKDKNFIK